MWNADTVVSRLKPMWSRIDTDRSPRRRATTPEIAPEREERRARPRTCPTSGRASGAPGRTRAPRSPPPRPARPAVAAPAAAAPGTAAPRTPARPGPRRARSAPDARRGPGPGPSRRPGAGCHEVDDREDQRRQRDLEHRPRPRSPSASRACTTSPKSARSVPRPLRRLTQHEAQRSSRRTDRGTPGRR